MAMNIIGMIEQQYPVRPDAPKTNLLALVAGAVAGYFIGKRYNHPVLGVLGGAGAADGLTSIATGKPVSGACKIATRAVAVGASIYWKEHPVLGYIGGEVASTALCAVALKGSLTAEMQKIEAATPQPRPALASPSQPALSPVRAPRN